MKVRSYEDLVVWQKSMTLAKEAYRLQRGLPKEETFALGDQIRRAAVSIPSNIAEGFGRDTDKEFKRFLSVARGSLYELKTQLQLAESLDYVQMDSDFVALMDEVGMLLNGLSRRLTTNC